MTPAQSRHRVLYMIGLVLAGEAVFALPFHVARFFRPTLLEVLDLSNTELGVVQAVYGVVAMLSYFPGGLLADRFPARTLICLSLWSTAAGGLYLSTLPGFLGAALLWGFFGLTSILSFWAALIRATRGWGGIGSQGLAFGLLDGGRGLLAAAWASAATLAFAWLFPADGAPAGMAEQRAALRAVILGYTLITAGAGLFTWFALADPVLSEQRAPRNWRRGTRSLWQHVGRVLRLSEVWLIAAVVVCAYVGFKTWDNYALYAVDAWGLTVVEAASLTALGAWVRPLAAVGAGLLGDRYSVSRMTVISFALLLASQGLFALLTPRPDLGWVLLVNLVAGSAAMFSLRTLYYALVEECAVPAAVTGTAVGLISVIGYSPDVFLSYLGGVLLDSAPGLAGHRHYFALQAAFAALGLAVSYALMARLRRRRSAD